ncbi:type IV toxin-antitoxin system AbiEi family antitoxin domain-containing protein [Streptomyces sp. NBC_00474]|uniref:type IV toxin-antitoxin system AbiEi family antitoxin domain-containing protein n=1 Tax=Streptomyces sp. NBC_00474 TaxID=2975754 RepID=UPI002254AAA4|nr:type IV toxin-antitoxin system AbiEi family antitoxin domain-containing protein [Streptomyces sp. NBC_00474]MCX5055049.1 type IV toxin-antitoxin system AbiEi family antitoxin domain-containing protein [Streptomyces sp. NBC_00474]
MDRAEQLAVLSGPAADQWGLITTAQAKELGVSAVQLLRLTEVGLLDNVSRGVYLLSASGMPRYVDIKAAWLRLQPKAFAWDRPPGDPDSGVISHASACQLLELGDIPAPEVEITVPRRRTTTEPFVRLRTAPLDREEITVVDGLPVTTALRTITDLLQAKADGGHIGGVIADANRRDLIILDKLADRVQPYARKYGLKATASGRDLIEHLTEQAGESLRRQEIARASEEGFDAAVHLLAEHPDLAGYLARHGAGRQRTVKETQDAITAQMLALPVGNLSDVLASQGDIDLTGIRAGLQVLAKALRETNPKWAQPGLSKSIQAINRKLAQPDPALTEAIRKLSQPNPALTQAIRNVNRRLAPSGLSKTLQNVNRKLSQPNPVLTENLRKLTQPNEATSQALLKTSALPPFTGKALENAADSIPSDRPAPAPSAGNGSSDDPDDRSPDREESC